MTDLSGMKKAACLIAFLALLPIVAFADGDVVIDVGGNDDFSRELVLAPDGRLYATASIGAPGSDQAYLMAFEATGLPATNFGTNGRTQTQFGPGALALRPDGSLILGAVSFEVYSSTGQLLSAVARCTIACTVTPVVQSWLPLADGRTYGGGGVQRGTTTFRGWFLNRITANGNLDLTFANGEGWAEKDGGTSNRIVALRALPNGQMIALGERGNTGAPALGRFNSDGSTDSTFGTNGLVPDINIRTSTLEIDQAQRMLVTDTTFMVVRRSADGLVDGSYTGVPPLYPQAFDFKLDNSDRAIVYQGINGQIHLIRLLANGGVDPTYSVGGESVLSPPGTGGSTNIGITDAAVDSSNRVVLLFTVQTSSATREIGLLRVNEDGSLDTTFGAGWVDADAYPDAYTITGNSAPFGTAFVVSNPITPTGFNTPAVVQLTATTQNSAFSVGCTGTFVTTESMIQPGQSLCVRHSAPPTAGATATTSIAVSGRTASYVTTASGTPADMTPDAFTFANQTDVARGANVVSNAVTISGITGLAAVSVDLGQFSIDCVPGNFRSMNTTITNGQTVCVRVTSSQSFGTPVSATLAVGGVTSTFTATTVAADTTPAAFSFASVADVATSAIVTSASATITGINTAAPISVSNGEYSVGCNGTFTAQAGTINPDQAVCVRHAAASAAGTTTVTTINVGGVSATFSSTTAAASGGGGGGGGGALSPRDLIWLAMLLLARLAAAAIRARKWTLNQVTPTRAVRAG